MENELQLADQPKFEIVNFEDYQMSAEAVVRQVQAIQEVMAKTMQEGQHYGKIPGTDKPTLLKPGAEKISLNFRFGSFYQIDRTEMKGGHREYEIICTLKHIPTGQVIGQGVGSCSTMESKYRYRKAEQTCPKCGKPAIIKGKKVYGGGWLCFAKKGGCGAKFKDGDPDIENQNMGRIEYGDPADYYNTVLKMAKKRAQVDAVLTATAASDIFTQDLEDLPKEAINGGTTPKSKPTGKPEPQKQPSQNENPATDKQKHFLHGLLKKKDLSDEEEKELVTWYAGDNLTTKKISELIDKVQNDWDGLIDDFLSARNSEPLQEPPGGIDPANYPETQE